MKQMFRTWAAGLMAISFVVGLGAAVASALAPQAASATSVSGASKTYDTFPPPPGTHCERAATVRAVSVNHAPDAKLADYQVVHAGLFLCANIDGNTKVSLLISQIKKSPYVLAVTHVGANALAADLNSAAATGKTVQIQTLGKGGWVNAKSFSAADAKVLANELPAS